MTLVIVVAVMVAVALVVVAAVVICGGCQLLIRLPVIDKKSKRRVTHTVVTSNPQLEMAGLLQNKIDMSQLVITKALAKTGTVFVYRVVD
jgi:hypothetical protein